MGKFLTVDGNGNTYTYNADGMISASSGASYVYDALNQRVAKTGGSNPGETIYFNGVPIALHNPTSGAYMDLLYANGEMIGEVAGTETAVPTLRLLDHLGSLAATTDSSGTVTGTNVFLPFGQTLTETTSDQFQFIGLPQDTENSSYHAGYRNFSTQQGRWLSPDPYNGSYDITNPQSFNRYSYVMNNPMGLIDPSGLDCIYFLEDDCVAISGGDCSSNSDDPGYYVDGTVDVGSLAYNGSYLDYNYTADDGAVGVGAIQFTTPDTDAVDYNGSLGSISAFTFTTPLNNAFAPSNGKPNQPQKPPCNPSTRIGGVVKAFDGFQTAGAAFTTAGIHFGAAALLFSAGCLDPTPFEPATCVAGSFGAAELGTGGLVLGGLGVYEVKDEVIPGIEQAISCEP